ncbi:MAG: LacI family DNA-binding transcriptional regulator [Microbacteriaceae bacterium]
MSDASRARGVRLADVAERAGVSISTASNALSGNRAVRAAYVERVLAAAAELGYRRNEVARSLRTGSRDTIGVVVPDVTNPFFADLIGRIEALVTGRGWSMVLINTAFDTNREAAGLARLISQTDGILLFSTRPDPLQVQPLVDLGMPVVACDEIIGVPGVGGVYSDNEDGGRQVARHLVEAGGRRIGMIQGPPTLPTAAARRRGFEHGLAECGVVLDPSDVVVQPYSLDGGRQGMRALLEAGRVDAVFASTDMQAIGAMFESLDRGVAVPERMLVCGFDGISWSERVAPALSTVRQDSTALAARSVEQLAAMIVDGVAAERTVLPVELVPRASTARLGAVAPPPS